MFVKAASVLALVASAAGHMTFVKPCARYSPDSFCPSPPSGEQVDYDMTTPIGSEGQAVSPICKHAKPYSKPVATWASGSTTTVTFSDGNGHSGGHCQFSISYDGGQTFVVLSESLKYCFYSGPANTDKPSVLNFDIPLPANLPGSPSAIFAWTWVNASGNREFYMNCADVAINGPAGSFTGKKMTIANYPGYPTIPEFLGNYNTGLQYYTNATQITVTGPGYGGGSGSTSSSSSTVVPSSTVKTTSSAAPSTTAATTTSVAPSTTSVAPSTTSTAQSTLATSTAIPTSTAPSTSSAPAPSSTSGGSGSCTEYAYQCSSDKSGYQICLGGAWSSTFACAAGTVCQTSGSSVYCGWP
ncbi:hypothetical protein GQ54DRAFT_299786 [Martensiomyces pterosporus]|nr:hypothetical protein GQ54DRAFT_299786 [Martensiomyces pterosporus]